MSKNEQTPDTSTLRRSLIVIIAVLVVSIAWFIVQANGDNKAPLNNENKTATNEETNKQEDPLKGWKSYTWASQGVTFKHPGDWFVSETSSMSRLYVKNSQVDLSKEETPANFQQVWMSYDTDEASKAREDAIKKGESAYRFVSSAVTASTVKAGATTINLYAYETVGGPTVEAYWTNAAGKRYYATTSTEVGQQNQTDMVANLKKILSSITLQ